MRSDVILVHGYPFSHGFITLIPGANNWLSFSCQHYVVIVDSKGINCGDGLNTARYLTSNTYLDLDFLCGNTYTLSVKAVTNNGSSTDKQTFISLPSQTGAVRSLAVKFIPGNNATRNNATDLIKQRVDGFWLTWEPPANVKPVDVKVGNKMKLVWLFNALLASLAQKGAMTVGGSLHGVCMASCCFLRNETFLHTFFIHPGL